MAVPGASLGERILAGQGPEFAEILETIGEAITVRDRAGHFVYANRAALRSLGFDSLEDLVGQPLRMVTRRYTIRDERGRRVPDDAIPSVRLLATGVAPEPLLAQTIDHRTGETRWERITASPLRDPDGVVVASVTIAEDVTAVKTAEIHTRVLAESGRHLIASLDYQQTLRNVTQAALPGLADWCMVELIDGGVREAIVVAHVDPELEPLAARLRTLEPAEPTAESALRRVLDSDEPVRFLEIPDEHLRRVAVSDEQLQIYRDLRIRSAMVVPMRAASRTIGAMSFFTSVSERRFSDEDLAVAEQLARRAAVAVENARMHTLLSGVTDTLQRSLLPSAVPDVPGWEIATLYRPAYERLRIEVGGDFYEVYTTDGNSFAMIGDVTGHGVQAATVTSLLRHGARFASHLEPDPVAIVRRLDEELRRRDEGVMATALCAALHDHSVLLCSAGHPPALVIDATGAVIEAPESGPLLGAFPDSSWQQQRVPVGDGDLVLLYTDGVTETVGAGDRYGTERLRELLVHHAGSPPQAVLQALAAELERFCGGAPGDDIAALALRPRPSPG